MSLVESEINASQSLTSSRERPAWWRSWLGSWELYLLLLVTALLRFYGIQTTEFDNDQVRLFRMAYDAIHQGLLPVTSNDASIGTMHPPGAVYLYMLPAAFSSDPVWAAVLVGLFSLLAVLLTYVLMRRYYGRLAGASAALLYATAVTPLRYARFIWQPNLMPPFVVLFIFALFWGVVERRKGWLFPALLLLGILGQLHEEALLLGAPLLLALLLAPGTLRWRDLALGLLALCVVFFPYLLWFLVSGFHDLSTVFGLAGGHVRYDRSVFNFYNLFLTPGPPPSDPQASYYPWKVAVSWLNYLMPLLVLAAFALVVYLLVRPWLVRRAAEATSSASSDKDARPAPCAPALSQRLLSSWRAFRADPYRCGLALLLFWQLFPLLFLIRHSVELHAQYLFILMPGPFMLLGILIARGFSWLRGHPGFWRRLMPAVYALLALIIVSQGLAATLFVLDNSEGHYNDRAFHPYHNDLASLKQALAAADHLAQQQHLSRVYVTTDNATQSSLMFLTRQMQTPTTLFDATNCLVLPAADTGPAVMLVGPYDPLSDALLARFAQARLVKQLPRLAGQPFKLYLVAPTQSASSVSAASPAFSSELRALDTRVATLQAADTTWLLTRWSLQRSISPQPRTTYSYAFAAAAPATGLKLQSTCTFNAMHAGDQLLAAFALPNGHTQPAALSLSARSYTTLPYNPTYGPFHLETDDALITPAVTLRTPERAATIILRIT